ncbi:amidohydrolase [Dethiobacter alkaliphilus]|uniref:Amidohydrolase 3 n=1 Tax=Dethiobacter alkaliphilus AHT 1 TaxID=555088 RepID=C0GEC0_DETAL|nr:amidohydrolase [Dethiobacter alkaliphilus]EEG78414.1 Amidohydrolase 3 [Dethiobacter alkaliphilus AHT 1]
MEWRSANLILVNGNIITMDGHRPCGSALAISDNHILFVGGSREALSFAAPGATVIDLMGRTVLPGLIDNHCHFMQTGYAANDVDLQGKNTIAAIKEAIAIAARYFPSDSMIRGYGYDDYLFPQGIPPCRHDLDKVAPNHLVWLSRVDLHSSVVNTPLLNSMEIPLDTPGLELDKKGEPTGRLRSEADRLVREYNSSLIGSKTRGAALREAVRQALRTGVTTVCAMEGGDESQDKDAEFLLQHQEQVPIRLEVFYQTTDVARVVDLGLPRIGGCILIDGSFGSRTAALLEPYADDPQNSGYLYFEQDELNHFVEEAHTAGLQLSMHVIGDRGIEMMLTSLEKVLSKYPRLDHRHRLEHFELPTPEHIRRARDLGLILSVQPAFEYFWGGADNMYGERLGPERVMRTNPLRTMVDQGLVLAGGSDSAVTPMDIILAIHAAVNHPNKEECLEVFQAIRMFTLHGAAALFREKELGSITPGKLADIIVLAEDPCFITAGNLKDINVDLTIVAGKIVYDRGGAVPLFDIGA